MPKVILFICISFLSFYSAAQKLNIDESEATIKFVFLDDEVEGAVSDFEFTGHIDASDLSNANFSGSVAMETLDTNNWLRNRHLRAKKYFYNGEHPRLSFRSNTIRGADTGKEFLIYGTLTIKGISKDVTWNVNNSGNRFYITGLINTSDFGIHIHKESDRNMTQVMISLPYSK